MSKRRSYLEQDGTTDVIDYFFPSNMNKDLRQREAVEEAIAVFEQVWQALKSDHKARRCQVLFVNTTDGHRVHSEVHFLTEPVVCVELSGFDRSGVTAHEAIHAITAAETGFPYFDDYSEGIAMRLGAAFQPESICNRPSSKIIERLQQIRERADARLSFSSEYIALAERAGIRLTSDEIVEMKYAFGYYFIDALLKNRRYQQLADDFSKKHGGRPYALVQAINKAYGSVALDLRRADATKSDREKSTLALKEVGFMVEEIEQIFDEADMLIGLSDIQQIPNWYRGILRQA